MSTLPSRAPIVDRRIRIAVVGCGRIAANHFDAIGKHSKDVELAAVCDNDRLALERAVASTGAKGFLDLSDLLANRAADLVALCTPSGLHPPQAIEAARAGRHVMTEKPMATRWRTGSRWLEACDRAGVRLFVVKQNRRNATLQLLKRAIAGGASGASSW